MTPKIIAFSGAHGTGKTTAANHLAEFLRANTAAGTRIGVIAETARHCPLPVYSAACSRPSASAQTWIFAAQLQAEIEAVSEFDIVVSDRTLVDCIAYTRSFGYYGLANEMEPLAVTALHRYREVVFHKIAAHDYLIDDGFRAMDVLPRQRIERIMLETYRRLRVSLLDSVPPVRRAWEIIKQEPAEGFLAV